MKKLILFTLFGLFFSLVSWAQLVTTNPAIVTQTGSIVEVTFDATLGNKGLMGFTGDVYAHTGVNSNLGRWQHAPAWGDNAAKYKLTPLGNNKWKFTISPDIATFYALISGETVSQLCFVFRSADKSKEGKDVGNADIFIDVKQAGLNVVFTNPASNKSVTPGTTDNITFVSSVPANLELRINGDPVKSATASTTLSHSFTYSNTIDYQLIAKAVAGGETKYDTIIVNVAAPVISEPRPAGLKDGITYSADGTQATLIMYAPGKNNVFLIGDMNNWSQNNDYQLKKDGNYWWITLTGLTPGKLYGFQYLVDGTIRVADAYTELVLDPWNDKWINEHRTIYPNIPAYPEGKTTGLVATLQSKKPAYPWEVSNFTVTNPDNMVIYEMLLRDFTSEKSLEAAIAKLDYLKTLGITAVELMPIQEFDGNNSWGYNPNLYFAPDKAYGTPDMYKRFIDVCHKRGMAVILDMVFNQANGLHPFALLYWNSSTNKPASNNPWMNVDAPHQFSVLNDFNHSFSGTREYFKRVLQYWLTEYKVDGFRMDLTKGFTQSSGTESVWDQNRINYLKEYNTAVKDVRPDAIFILEHFVGGTEEDYLASQGMYLWRNMNNAYNQSAMGYQSGTDFSGMNSFPRKWVGYAESHDEERNFLKAKENGNGIIYSDSIVRIGRVPLNIAFTTLTPGPKMIWQFGEIGYDYSINSFGGRTNPKPSAFGWLNLPHRKAAYDKSAKIVSLKKKYPVAFTMGNYNMQIGSGDWNNGKRIAITHDDLNMVMLGNFQPLGSTVGYPNFPKTGMWYELLTGEELNVTNTQMQINVNAGDVKIYTDRKVDFGSGVNDLKSEINYSIHPSVTTGKVWISTSTEVRNVNIYNVQGALQMSRTNTAEIDAAQLSSGMYLMEIVTDEGKAIEKFVKR